MRHFKNSRLAIAMLAMSACSIEAAGTATIENPAGVSAARQPVEYICREKSLVGNEMYEAGQRVFYAGLPAENLEPTCDIGRARYQEYLESNQARVAKMIADNRDSEYGIGDAKSFMAALMRQREEDRRDLAEQLAAQSAAQAQAIGAAVGNAMASAFAAFFPNGLPVAAPAAPAAPVAVADTPAAPVAGTAQDQPGDSATSGDTGAPAKRTKG